MEYPYASGECVGYKGDFGVPVKERGMAFRARGRGRRGIANKGGNVELLEEIRRLQTRLEALEVNRR